MRNKTRISLTTDDIAQFLGCSASTVRKLISIGNLSITGNTVRDLKTLIAYKINFRHAPGGPGYYRGA